MGRIKRTMRALKNITYHGRVGKPVIHLTGANRPYIMVRAVGGGVKRLYLDTAKASKEITKGFSALMRSAKKLVRKQK